MQTERGERNDREATCELKCAFIKWSIFGYGHGYVWNCLNTELQNISVSKLDQIRLNICICIASLCHVLIVTEVTNNPTDTMIELWSSSVEIGETSRKLTITATCHQSGLYGRVEATQWKTQKNPFGICTKAPEGLSDCENQDSLVWWNQNWIVWSQF